LEAAKGTDLEPLSGAERADFLRLRMRVIKQEKDNDFLKKSARTSRRIYQSGTIRPDRSGVRKLRHLTYGSFA
jgi:hypothetical protein